MLHQLLLPPLLAANHLFDRHRLQFISSHSQQNLLISSDSNPASCCSAFCLSSTLQCLWNQFSMFFLKQNTNFHVEQNWKLTCTRVSYCVEYIYVGRMGGKYYSSRSKLERGWQRILLMNNEHGRVTHDKVDPQILEQVLRFGKRWKITTQPVVFNLYNSWNVAFSKSHQRVQGWIITLMSHPVSLHNYLESKSKVQGKIPCPTKCR